MNLHRKYIDIVLFSLFSLYISPAGDGKSFWNFTHTKIANVTKRQKIHIPILDLTLSPNLLNGSKRHKVPSARGSIDNSISHRRLRAIASTINFRNCHYKLQIEKNNKSVSLIAGEWALAADGNPETRGTRHVILPVRQPPQQPRGLKGQGRSTILSPIMLLPYWLDPARYIR